MDFPFTEICKTVKPEDMVKAIPSLMWGVRWECQLDIQGGEEEETVGFVDLESRRSGQRHS